MGRTKEELAMQEGLYQTAQNIAVAAGAIKECEYHPGTYLSCKDQDAENMVYAIGTNKIKAGELDCSREELMGAIKEVIDKAGDECCLCERWKDE